MQSRTLFDVDSCTHVDEVDVSYEDVLRALPYYSSLFLKIITLPLPVASAFSHATCCGCCQLAGSSGTRFCCCRAMYC